jgi:elongation factor Ts
MVKELRERTDAPMMDCKKALTEAEGDSVRAEEIIRVRFGNKASKAAGRVAAEGTVGVYISADGKSGAMIEVNSETDFCAKNEDFLKFVNELATIVATNKPADIAAAGALAMGSSTVEETRAQLVGKIGENVTPRRFVCLAVQGKLTSYIHGSKIGVLVDLVGGDEALAKDIAMHIAAAKPKSLDASGIDASLIETERRVAIEKAKEAGKPEAMLEKIADGTVAKFLKEVTLLSQTFVKDDKLTIEQLLKSKGASVASFTMFTVGEGIEKAVVDYAAEVAAAAAAI